MKLVNVRGMKPNTPGITYIGREFAGWAGSPLGNPFKIGRNGDRTEVLVKYRKWLVNQINKNDKAVVGAMMSLTARTVLGCWCKTTPDAAEPSILFCHGQIIARIWESDFGGEEY